eukprot:8949146-Pyramimonas_sp.AAC.1
MSIYCLGVDAGPDNKGMINIMRRFLAPCKKVAFCAVYCKFHQAHLIAGGVLTALDNFKWATGADEAEKEAMETSVKYWGAVATVANVWRSSGTHRKLQDAACA